MTSGASSALNREFAEAIHAQPRNLRLGHEAFVETIGEVDLGPLREGTIVFSGIGASAHALVPVLVALRAAGRRAFAVPPSELRSVRAAGIADSFVLVSQSGASTEPLDALAHLDGAPVIAVTARGDTPLAEGARGWLPLGPLEDTPVATLSYTATLQVLGMLGDALLGTSSGWPEIPALADGVLQRSQPFHAAAGESFLEVVAIDAVGGGAARASAGEAALLAREGLRVPATGMETREYLHGPLEAVGEGFGCVLFGGQRERELAGELVTFGARVALLTDEGGAVPTGVEAIELPRAAALAAPILQILPVQLLIDQIARLRDSEIGALRRQQSDTKVA